MGQKRQKYNITFAKYQVSQYVISNCSDITFINTGLTNGFINDFLLVPGASIGFTAQFNEVDTTSYNLIFPTDLATSKTSNNEMSVIKKVYL